MNQHNADQHDADQHNNADQNSAEDKPAKKSWDGFACDLFQSPKSNDQVSGDSQKLDFETFESWLEDDLQLLEFRFAHNMTANSVRSDIKAGR